MKTNLKGNYSDTTALCSSNECPSQLTESQLTTKHTIGVNRIELGQEQKYFVMSLNKFAPKGPNEDMAHMDKRDIRNPSQISVIHLLREIL